MSRPDAMSAQKRKATYPVPGSSSQSRKRQKFQDVRNINTQPADAALSRNGELNIGSFVKAREYEINALDKSMKKARQGLSSRAFQMVPRHLRRRTASHNVKKVPRRLRGRAKREMIEDNTPTVDSKTRLPSARLRLRLETAKALKKLTQKRKTVRQKKREAKANAANTDPSKHLEVVHIPRIKKNHLTNPPSATSKFKRRQVSKTWLPTHLWHTKRAHMTRSTEPLWRMAIPLSPTEKPYRATHRASGARGCVAWDMSYISTVGCRGTDAALETLLKALSFHGHGWVGPKYKRWKAGSRFAEGWIIKRGNQEALAPVAVMWCANNTEQDTHKDTGNQSKKPSQTDHDTVMEDSVPQVKRKKTKLNKSIMIRIHPSAFHQIWLELLHLAKSQKPQVLVEDLRFEIASVDITGADSTEALLRTLTPCENNEHIQNLMETLRPLSNPALLPLQAMVSFDARDPRIVRNSRKNPSFRTQTDEEKMHETIVNWPLDTDLKPSSIFSQKARFLAGQMPSQWALNRRRKAVLPGQALSISAKDPSIPITLLAHRAGSLSTSQQGTWTMLVPWMCLDVIWRTLISIPLSSGNKPRFGGLREKQQVLFEQSTPWFPGDYPGTEAGRAWEVSQAEKRFDNWIRHPPSRRPAWEKLDLGLDRRGELGRGWACDWEYLLKDTDVQSLTLTKSCEAAVEKGEDNEVSTQPLLTQRQRRAANAKAQAEREKATRQRNTSSPESDDGAAITPKSEAQFIQLTPAKAKLLLQLGGTAKFSQPALATIRITYLSKGTPKEAARIYRLPVNRQSSSSPVNRENKAEPIAVDASQEQNAKPIQPPCDTSPRKHNGIPRPAADADLRTRWLSLDSGLLPQGQFTRIEKDKSNHRGFAPKQEHYAEESLRHINVIPKNAPEEVRKQYGPKSLSEEETRLILERELAIRMEEEKVWDKHIPCPNPDDLIGFVTTGGYNLVPGRGTAVGSIWTQRVLQGWHEDSGGQSVNTVPNSTIASGQRLKQQQKLDARSDRKRHLCVVRNAGESVGRLALWQLCE